MDVYTTEYFTVAVYVALAVICLLGNTWVIITVLRQFFGCFTTNYNYLHTLKPAIYSASVYLLLLSVVDLISILPVPVLVVDILNNDFPFQPNLLGSIVCKLIFFCEGANKSLSPLVLTVLSIDRYVAVCRPGWICLRRPKVACFMLLICFLLSLCFIAPVTSVAMIGPMVDEKNRSHSKCYLEELPLSWKFDIFHILGCYILPLIIICSVYASILRRLYRHAHSSTVGSKTSIPLHRVVKCSAAVVGFYFICWTPYWTIRMGYITDEYQSTQNVTISAENGTSAEESEAALAAERMSWTKVLSIYFFHSLPYAQSAFNWLFYAFLNRNLRNASSRPSASGRSNGVTSVLIDHPNNSANGNYTSWRSHKGGGFGVRKPKLNLRLEVPLRYII
uniref:G_PROTEIN_RECEP_F1_2 domain-containing protein n=1 Tax=Syphacia muris TaxID=451379 RepID=A0A0N5A7L1_9BILA